MSQSLAHPYERWDGKGDPKGLAGAEVPVAVRIVTVARDMELWARLAGWAAAPNMSANCALRCGPAAMGWAVGITGWWRDARWVALLATLFHQ